MGRNGAVSEAVVPNVPKNAAMSSTRYISVSPNTRPVPHEQGQDNKGTPASPAISEDADHIRTTKITDQRDGDQSSNGRRRKASIIQRHTQQDSKHAIGEGAQSTHGYDEPGVRPMICSM